MWWLFTNPEEEILDRSEEGERRGDGASSRGASSTSRRGRSRTSRSRRSRTSTSSRRSRTSSVSGGSSSFENGRSRRSRVSIGVSGVSRNSRLSRNSRNKRNPSRKTRGRPHFPSTFSVNSGYLANDESGLSSSGGRRRRTTKSRGRSSDDRDRRRRSRSRGGGGGVDQSVQSHLLTIGASNTNSNSNSNRGGGTQMGNRSGRSVRSALTENTGFTGRSGNRSRRRSSRSRSRSRPNTTDRSSRRSSRASSSRAASSTTSRSRSGTRRSRASSSSRGSRPQRNIRIPRAERMAQRRRGGADSVSSLESEAETTASHFERIKQSFFGAIEDLTEQIQLTIAEHENESTTRRDDADDDTVQYDNTGRISLQPANPRSFGSASYWSGSQEEDYWDDDIIFARAISALRFAIFADAINSQVLGPNYALLVEEDAHQDSFPSTAPFGFGAAYYFMPMCADIGMVLSSVVMGYLSDKPSIGRTRCVLACMYFGAVGSALKYLGRNNFWTFCAANFFTGLFGGSLAVGMAYVSDIFIDRMQTDAEIGIIVATNMIGRTGGGVLAIAMQSVGLFEPLLVSAGISFVAGVLCHIYMCDVIPWDEEEEDYDSVMEEGDHRDPSGTADTPPSRQQNPNDNSRQSQPTSGAADVTESSQVKPKSQEMSTASESLDMTMSYIAEEDENYPTELDPGALMNVILGELADNLGSIGLVPICLAPLMWQTFHADFVEAEPPQDPIMSATSYKWIYVFIALIVIPGAIIAPVLFAKWGPAMCAVLANLLTGAVTIILLQIANIDPPTFATYCIFVTVLYTAFPLTVISQLSTGPMLDRIAPLDQRGQIQGLNMAAMNTATALGPFVYGLLADATSVDVTLYVTSAVSVIAAFVNYQLVGDERFGPTQPDEDDEDFYSDGIDEMSGMDPSSAPPPGTTSEHPSSRRSPGSILPSTATRSVASLAHELHVEFLPSFF